MKVVTLAVHFYFLATLMGNQYLDVTKGYEKHRIDLVVPFFTFLEVSCDPHAQHAGFPD